MDFLINQYMEELKIRNLSSNTLDAYYRDINNFYNFLKEKGEEINSVDSLILTAYVNYLKSLGKSDSSIARNIVSLRNFYKYLMKRGLIYDNPVILYEAPKVQRELPDILTYEEVDKLLKMPETTTNKGIRDKAMLETMYATGLKVTELTNLKVSDISLKFKYVRCIGSKNKERIVPMGNYACMCIEKYLSIRDIINVNNEDYLFLNLKGQRMTRQGFWKIMRCYAEEANINKDINTITLRHSCAVHMLENGADIKLIQELLGHNALAATQIYFSMINESKLSEVYQNTHPRAYEK